jgi:hypothetical protein
MTDICIAYSHEDTDFVRDLVKPLAAEGFSVWWDHTIPPGQSNPSLLGSWVASGNVLITRRACRGKSCTVER